MEDYSDNDDDDYDDYDVNRYMPLHILPSLRVLELLGVSKLVNLPVWLQRSSNLQRLEICRCQKLNCLPDWLTKLTALESMNVRKCKILSERCGSNKAEDWPNIAQIPNITVDSAMIQKDGHYLEGEDTEEEEEEEEEQPEEENEEASSHTQFWRYILLYYEACYNNVRLI
ncbi:Disease resistance protein RGA2 [Linum perenne]